MNRKLNRNLFGATAAILAACLAGAAWGQKSDPAPTPPQSVPAADLIQAFKAAGKATPITVVPTRLGGKSMSQVGEAVAMFLERAGMTNLETSSVSFDPPENADLAQSAKAFADFVRANPPLTEYSLFTDFIGTRQTGLTEVRGIIVDKQGRVIWQDRQVKGDADFDRVNPKEPMQCCFLLVDRLRPILGLGDPAADDAPEGKIAEQMRKATGVPDKAEMDAIAQRGEAFKKAAAGATLLIYPAHAGDAYSPESATGITTMLNAKKLTKAAAIDQGPKLEIASNMNEQKVLWAMAHGFSDYVRKNPPKADFVLFADYLMGKDMVGGVHFAICNKQGELVVVDFQNNHWPDFKAIDPKSREDCDKLVAKRLEGYCK